LDSYPSCTNILSKGFWYNYFDIVFGLLFFSIAIFFHLYGFTILSVATSAIAIGLLSISVSELAEILAQRLEEPYSTFVLTFSAVIVEIILLFMILLEATGANNALTTVKGTIISAVIVDMNVLLGLAILLGGLNYKKQTHNEETSATYTTILLVAACALLVPSIITYTDTTKDSLFTASVAIAFVLLFFYIAIFIFQTKTHSDLFKATAKSRFFRLKNKQQEQNDEPKEHEEEDANYFFEKLSNMWNLFFIFLFIFIIGFLAEIFASDGMIVANQYGVSSGLAGLIIAIIAVAPEILTAVRAAKADEMQRVVNIAMGASTVSIMITVPFLMALAYLNGIYLSLDFNALQIGALLLTIILAWKTTENGDTNYFEGLSHLTFFILYMIMATLYSG